MPTPTVKPALFLLGLGALLLLPSPDARAQGAEDRTDARQQQLLGQAPTVAPQRLRGALAEDGGDPAADAHSLVRITYRAGVTQDFLYESNADYNGNSGQGSFSYTPTVLAGAEFRFSDSFRVDASGEWLSTWYSDLGDNADFWGLTGRVLACYRPFAQGPEFFAGPELARFEQWNDGAEISKSVGAVGGLRYGVEVRPGTGLFATLRGGHRWTDPGQFDRHHVSVFLGATQRLAPGLFLQPGYSFAYADYVRDFSGGVSREDLRHEVSLALLYRINEQWTVRLCGSFADNDSSFGPANYQNISSGLNSGFIVEF